MPLGPTTAVPEMEPGWTARYYLHSGGSYSEVEHCLRPTPFPLDQRLEGHGRDPPKPDSPNINDEQVSQIDDEEMARMNIEISAALAWWLALSGSDDRRYWDLVARALAHLPTGPKAVSALRGGEILLASIVPELAAQVRRSWPADRLERDMETATNHGIRVIANTITHIAFRTARSKASMRGSTLAMA